jgi:hypothetical protein
MIRTICLTAALSSALTLCAVYTLGVEKTLPRKLLLENAKVRVTEVTYPPGEPRLPHIRPSDQVIVFLDDCKYERTDPVTGEKTVRERKAGEVIWHDRTELAPQLTNVGTKTYRSLLIEIKDQF